MHFSVIWICRFRNALILVSSKHEMRFLSLLFLTTLCCLRTAPAHATTKGLSQIVTPDLQPAGDLSLSGQWQSSHVANPYEAQLELGLTDFAEVTVFKGSSRTS